MVKAITTILDLQLSWWLP